MNARSLTEAEVMEPVSSLRIPPHSIEAEQSVLGGLLLDNGAWDRVGDILTERDFYSHDHRLIWTAISSIVNACKPADVLTTWEHLRSIGKDEQVGGLAYLNALAQSVVSAANARRYAEIVREKSLRRALIATLDEAATLAWNGAEPAPQMTDRVVTLLDRVQQGQVEHKPRQAAELVIGRLDHYSAMETGEKPTGAPTGLAKLDEALNGGLQEGRVYVLAARPSIGKTSLAMQIGLHRAKAGDGVLLLSQEMPAEECVDRALCNLGPVDYGNLQRATMTPVDWSSVTEATDILGRLPFWIDDQAGLTLADIRAKAMSLRRQGLKLLIVDYLQLCAGTNPGRGSTRNGEIEELTRGIKTLAKQLRISVLLLSQLSREVEKRATPEPNLGDLRDSGAIEQDADCVLFLWFVRAWSDRKFIGMGIAKNRQGVNGGRFALEFRGNYQRWADSDADISTQRKSAASSGGLD